MATGDEIVFDDGGDGDVERVEGELLVLAVRTDEGDVQVSLDLASIDDAEECGQLLALLAVQFARGGAEVGRWPEVEALEKIKFAFAKAWTENDLPGANTLLS